jgi:hypothetical protein
VKSSGIRRLKESRIWAYKQLLRSAYRVVSEETYSKRFEAFRTARELLSGEDAETVMKGIGRLDDLPAEVVRFSKVEPLSPELERRIKENNPAAMSLDRVQYLKALVDTLYVLDYAEPVRSCLNNQLAEISTPRKRRRWRRNKIK